MITKIFRFTYLLFLLVMALVVGAACYQTISIAPYWKEDISLFRNYNWGIHYFPILSPLMTVLWLVILITGFKIQMKNKALLYIAHVCFLLIMVSTFAYFAPFLLTYMGHPDMNIPEQELKAMLNTWMRRDLIRQVFGLVSLFLFIYCYGKVAVAVTKKSD
ncbi:MAG TPA: hypothetical protein PKC54_05560 [Ferruginibacter sp.]|nr:hypothetical protein [Ferruginibacter sp.]